MKVLRATLTAICSFTILATVYLTLSVVVLQPPNLKGRAWALQAFLFVAQSGFTLFAIHMHRLVSSSRKGTPGVARGLALTVAVGATAICWAGYDGITAALSAGHFEGYALILGCALMAQGTITVLCCAPDLFAPSPRPS